MPSLARLIWCLLFGLGISATISDSLSVGHELKAHAGADEDTSQASQTPASNASYLGIKSSKLLYQRCTQNRSLMAQSMPLTVILTAQHDLPPLVSRRMFVQRKGEWQGMGCSILSQKHTYQRSLRNLALHVSLHTNCFQSIGASTPAIQVRTQITKLGLSPKLLQSC